MFRFAMMGLVGLITFGGVTAPGEPQAVPGSTPGLLWVCEQASKHCVEVDFERQLTSVYSVVNGKKEALLWQMYGAFPVAVLASGGDHLVLGTQQNVNVTEALKPETVMVYFVERGRILSRITFGDWYPGVAIPEVDGAPLSWGRYLGIGEDELFKVELANGERVAYQPRTGERVDERSPLEKVEAGIESLETALEGRAGASE